jgi:hypothetical protein
MQGRVRPFFHSLQDEPGAAFTLRSSAAPSGLGSSQLCLPGTYVPGYIVSPLRGWCRFGSLCNLIYGLI